MKLRYFVLVGIIALISSFLVNSENFQDFSKVFAQSDKQNKNFENAKETHSSQTSNEANLHVNLGSTQSYQHSNFENAQSIQSSETSVTKKEDKKPIIRQDYDSKIHPSISKILQNANPKAIAKAMGAKIDGDQLYVNVYLNDKINSKALGIDILREKNNIIVSKLSWSQIQSLAESDAVRQITLPEYAVPFEHGVSEGVAFSMADQMHAAGFDGTGVKVAVIDTDFFLNNTHISNNVVFSWYSPVYCSDLACGATYGLSHGTAVSEIVTDMAPGVDLYLYSIGDSGDFEDAIDSAVANDVDIITASLGFPDATGQNEFFRDGTSFPAQKVNQARNNQTLVTIAAGNDGQVHWSGFYTPNATRLGANLEADLFDPDTAIVCEDMACNFPVTYESLMMFNSSATNSSMQACLPINYHNGTQITINWSDWPLTDQDYDFFIYDSTASNFLNSDATAISVENGDDPPMRHTSTVMLSTNPQDVCLIVASYSSTQDHLFHIDADSHTANTFNLPDFDSGRYGSLSTPADATGALTIGAVNFKTNETDYSDDEIELFSSRGPTDDSRIKPEICGPDRTSTSQILFNSGIFPGTSGATPHVAGAAALLLEQDPSLNVTQLEQKLIDVARTNGDFSLDNLCGSDSGSLSLSNLVDFCTVPVSGNFTVTSDCTLSASGIAPANVIVENNSTLTIPPDVTLDIDFTNFDLIMKSGGMVLVKKGGNLN